MARVDSLLVSESISATAKKGRPGKRMGCFIVLGVTAILCGAAWFFVMNVFMKAGESAQLEQLQVIAMAIDDYSFDHQGHYPDGKSSTDVFQQLIDGGYIADIGVVYAPLDGKVRPVPGQKLKPENVGFDYTAGADASAPDGLPLVFRSGYRVAYAPGAVAVPLPERIDWLTWLWHRLLQPRPWSHEGISVTYVDRKSINETHGRVTTFLTGSAVTPDGSIPNFVPADFQTDGKTYRQLTPDGELQ